MQITPTPQYNQINIWHFIQSFKQIMRHALRLLWIPIIGNAWKIFLFSFSFSFLYKKRSFRGVSHWWRLLCRASMIEFLFRVYHLGNEIFIGFQQSLSTVELFKPSATMPTRRRRCWQRRSHTDATFYVLPYSFYVLEGNMKRKIVDCGTCSSTESM